MQHVSPRVFAYFPALNRARYLKGIEPDEHEGGVHVEHFFPAVLHEFPDREVCISFPTELPGAVGMFLAPGDPDTPAVLQRPFNTREK
jgi:hypothetical protein